MSKGIRITVEDLETGQKETRDIAPGDFVFIPVVPCYLGNAQTYPKTGTTQLTVKNHRPQNVQAQQQEGV